MKLRWEHRLKAYVPCPRESAIQLQGLPSFHCGNKGHHKLADSRRHIPHRRVLVDFLDDGAADDDRVGNLRDFARLFRCRNSETDGDGQRRVAAD